MTAAELIEEVGAAGYRIDLDLAGRPQLVKVWAKECLSPELLAALKANREQVIELLSQCEVCGRCVASEEDRARMVDPAFCDRYGSKALFKGDEMVAPATPRCPFKEYIEGLS